MHVFLTIPNLSKRDGGPSTVVQHLSEQLVSAGTSVSVVTSEPHPGDVETLPRDQRVNLIHVPGSSRGRSAWAFGRRLHETLEQKLAGAGDVVVHDFGLWLPANHAVISVSYNLGLALVCSPCGMLAPWALRHKPWKKIVGWWLYQRRDLSCATLLAATSEQEVRDIRRWVPKKNVALVPNGVEIPASSAEPRRGAGNQPRKIVFLGRIHPVKGLKNLVEAWHLVRPAGWHCILAGPDEAGHQTELGALLRQRNLASVFEFPGMIEGERKWALLREADVFVLPSFTENFGVAAAEALACAVPVITTKGTPWKDLVDHRCGWWVAIGAEPLAAALREATSLSDPQRYKMGQRGLRLVEEKYSWPQIGANMKAVYDWVLGGGAKPACVIEG